MSRAHFITELTGGLGNQMFQYALGRALMLRHGGELLFDFRALGRDPQRSYALGGMRVTGRVAEPAELPMARGRLTRRVPWISQLLGGPKLVAERCFTYDPPIAASRPPVALHGYWQSERYFADVSPVIREDFGLVRPFSASRAEVARQIGDAPAPVSVHVRRGDYVSDPVASAYHGICEPAWYAGAKRTLEARVAAPSYFVFSDDSDWARVNLPEFAGAVFVAPSEDGRDEQDMHLMALCHHHIIANSSFSWWGAWLNPRSSKLVIAPRRWFAGAPHDTRDLIPDGWVQL